MAESATEFIERKSRQWNDELRAGKPIRTKDVGRQGWNTWVREAWTFHPQHNHAEKVLVIERLRRGVLVGTRAFEGGSEVGDIEYRFGYYIVGRIGRATGRWTWGQFSPLIPQQDLAILLEAARRDGTFLDWRRVAGPRRPAGHRRPLSDAPSGAARS